jgi:hypothetical protein
MYKYRSKCRWNMLLHIDGEVVEIRPSELFESKTLVTSRHLELASEPLKKKKKEKATKKAAAPKTFIEDSYGNSSST